MGVEYRFNFKRLDVYRLAVEHFRWTCDVAARMPKGPWEVVKQSISASLSIMGNVGEANGRGRKFGEVEQHYRYAQGSTFEAATHLDAFAALKVIDEDEYGVAEDRLARIAAMLASLTRRQRRQAAAKRRNAKRRSHAPTAALKAEPSRSDVPARAQRAPGMEPRAAGPRGSGNRPSNAGPGSS